MTKNTLRKEYLQRRMDMPEEEFQQQIALMAFNFKKLPLPAVRYLLSYFPMVNRHEFDIAVCEDIVRHAHPAMQLALPRVETEGHGMEACLVEKGGLFLKNRFNVPEPVSEIIVPPADIDLVFVPLVAFDKQGYRVGYGKGYYDRFLARCRPDLPKVGFSFFEAVDSITDIDQFDVPLDFCITPFRIYEF
ncbi:MAG: 5-formyltetrahydrofolate cyclo-ligase [Candidatus Pseudobacter hemicellulosilyticus]|uniref:5-formyltetrahydrofolate cyclo-ligase n=1 Tax=Candidatus Pseudobacter hemicellulosilyticus TaxID=3121375 RepID=A0AAJ6BGC8_9BACT|nr:MAG: 5-formyltetrahydrofolate cyclo-ligase [Pseudobacter sp.]